MLTAPKPHDHSPVSSTTRIRVALLGFGTVGQGTYRMLQQNAAAITRKTGCTLEIAKIGIADRSKPRAADQSIFTDDCFLIVNDPSIDVVVEVIGGVSPAKELIESAIRNGKHVVTANKKLLATSGADLLEKAATAGRELGFEAAVGGGIPLIQSLKHQLAGNEVEKLIGILNGTTNYILSRMSEDKLPFAAALAEAQRHGFAEADSTDDIEGYDAAYKLSILTSIALGSGITPDRIFCEGISSITPRDLELAESFGLQLKLLAIAERTASGIFARVHPTLLSKDHPLARIDGVNNALWIRGNFVGDLLFSGKGAGGDATASAVVGDLIDVARKIRYGGTSSTGSVDRTGHCLPIEELMSAYYVRLIVEDKPCVLGKVATIFGNEKISLASMQMKVLTKGRGEIVFLTHSCREGSIRRALERLGDQEAIQEIANWIRVESTTGGADEVCN